MAQFIRCSVCGKQVSNSIGVEVIVRAFVECPECIASGTDKGIEQSKDLYNKAYEQGKETERERITKLLHDKYSMDARRTNRAKIIAKDLVIALIIGEQNPV